MTILLVILALVLGFTAGFLAGRAWLAQAITNEMELMAV